MTSKRLITVALGSAILGLLMGYLVLPPLAQQAAPQPPVPVEAPAPLQTRELPESEAQIQLSFAPVVRNATPSVVNVYATTVTQETVSPFAADPFFRRFFGDGGMLRQRRDVGKSHERIRDRHDCRRRLYGSTDSRPAG